MSTSSTCAISSRKPPKCGALKNARSRRPEIAERRDLLPESGDRRVVAPRLARSSAAARWPRRSPASESACATVGAIGFSQSTGRPANSASMLTGWCAAGTVTLTPRPPPSASATTEHAGADDDTLGPPGPASVSRRSASATSRSTTPTSSDVRVREDRRRSRPDPSPPAPTSTTRSGFVGVRERRKSKSPSHGALTVRALPRIRGRCRSPRSRSAAVPAPRAPDGASAPTARRWR